MNERIKELAEQCRGNPMTSAFEPTFDKEKFARLIVRNNIQTLRGNGYDDAAQCLQDIHFGIEDPV